MLNSQWVWDVKILVICSCLIISGGRLFNNDNSAGTCSSSTGIVECHVGRNKDIWFAFERTPYEMGTWNYLKVNLIQSIYDEYVLF